MSGKIGVAEQVAAGLLIVAATVIALGYFSTPMNWIWKQLW